MLTYMGLTPDVGSTNEWNFYDVADLGLGQWVVIESRWDPDLFKSVFHSSGVFRFGKWSKPIAPAVYNESLVGGINRDARYIWRAPNIAPNTEPPPTPPQDQSPPAVPGNSWASSGLSEIYYTGPMNDGVSYGPNGGPGDMANIGGGDWFILDGSPTRWARVAVGVRMVLQGSNAVPLQAGFSVNGKYFECSTWKPWSENILYYDASIDVMWTSAFGGWETSTYTIPYGSTTYNAASFEISVGTRYAVALAVHSDPVPGSPGSSRSITNICVADRSTGVARSVKWNGTAFAGPLVQGNTAIFYALPNDDLGSSVVRVILDLKTMAIKTENCPADHVSGMGTYAPSYFSDVPRIIELASEGSGGGPHRLAMDNDVLEILSSSVTISYSGNNLMLRPPPPPPTRFQGDPDPGGGYVELVVWSPDSNLAGGDDRPKGYFL